MDEYIEGRKPYSSIAIANELIKRGKIYNFDITHLKLQKLVYFAHALHLALEKKPLIQDEVQAWKYGPVIPRLFKECAKYGKEKIKDFISLPVKIGEGFHDLEFVPAFINTKDVLSNSILDAIIKSYGPNTAEQLSNMAHSENSAWDRTKEYHREGENRDFVIPIELIGEAEKSRFGIQNDDNCAEIHK